MIFFNYLKYQIVDIRKFILDLEKILLILKST